MRPPDGLQALPLPTHIKCLRSQLVMGRLHNLNLVNMKIKGIIRAKTGHFIFKPDGSKNKREEKELASTIRGWGQQYLSHGFLHPMASASSLASPLSSNSRILSVGMVERSRQVLAMYSWPPVPDLLVASSLVLDCKCVPSYLAF